MKDCKKRVLIFTVVFLLLTMTGTFTVSNLPAAQSRGIGIIALDTASGEKKEVPLYEKSYAVVIGIDQYKNLPFDMQLSYAVRDAKAVEDVLKKHFKFDEIIALYNKDATKANIMKALSGDLSKVGKDDSVFIFWAGHGYTEKTDYGDLGYLIPFDGTFEESDLYKNISMTMIKDDISKRIPAKHIFYVMDSCYSGLLAPTRGADRKTERNYEYLQEITKEKVRQVLTAGSKEQTVLDGGPNGHSVFTGRFIEILENTDDFITATEISIIVKERVFSDAKARGHVQTPKYGELFGLGDYVFVPSLERKVKDTEARLSALLEEKQRLEALEREAVKASNEQAQRQADLEKRAVLAKIKAEQLKKERLAEAEKKKRQEEAERQRKEAEFARKKQETEAKLVALKKDVAAKRMAMGETTLQSLSPTATIKQMQEVDARIQAIKADYRKELANAIRMVSEQVNDKFKEAANAKKDEFESQVEFERRVENMKKEAGREQTNGFVSVTKKIEEAYNKELAPFIEELKRLSGKEFTILAQDLTLELGQYDGKFNTYPVTIKSKAPIGGVLVACSANIPIPREEARVFKQHFANNILRPEISGNFQSTGFFRVAQAYVIDDATNKKYDLFSSKFVDLGNGVIYDSRTKLLWVKDGNYFKKEMTWDNAIKACERLTVAGLSGWRLPTKEELMGLVDRYYKPTINPVFDCVSSDYWSSTMYAYSTARAWSIYFSNGDDGWSYKSTGGYVRAVRGGQ